MARKIQCGDVRDYTAESATNAGSVVVDGAWVGVVIGDIKAGGTGSIAVSGVWEVPKGTATFTAGAAVYWNASNGYATATATDKYMGRAWAANSSSSAGTVLVRLEGGGDSAYANPS